MKKLLSLFFTMIFLTVTSTASADVPPRPTTAGFVFDYEDKIDDDIEAQLNAFAYELQEQGKMELFILTVDTIGDLEPVEYGLQLFQTWGIGDKETNNGLVIYATTDMGSGNNVIRISTGYGLESNYPDDRTAQLIEDYMKPYLVEGDYTNAFYAVAHAINEQEQMNFAFDSDPPESTTTELGIGEYILILFVIIFPISLLFSDRFHRRFRTRQARRFAQIFAETGQDLRTKSFIRYEQRMLKKGAIRKKDGSFIPPPSSDSSFSGGGGDSGGGGSDSRF